MILVTGATGLLGGHLLWHLLHHGERIIALKRTNSDLNNLKSIFCFYGSSYEQYKDNILWHEGDVLDFDSVLRAMKDVKQVYHCAAMVSLGKNDAAMIQVNSNGTENLVKAALQSGVNKFCLVSSIAALPDGDGISSIHELTPPVNGRYSTYGKSKILAEEAVERGVALGLNAVIVNPGVILGYSSSMTGSGELFRRVKKGLPFYNDGATGYVSVGDVVGAMILLMNSDVSNERYVLVGDNCKHRDVLAWMAVGYGKKPPFIYISNALMLFVSVVSEFVGKVAGFKPLIDTASAKTSLSKKRYSSEKFLTQFPGFKFSSIEETVKSVCSFDTEYLRNPRY